MTPPLIVPIARPARGRHERDDVEGELREPAARTYRRDAAARPPASCSSSSSSSTSARKVVGVGSVGTRAWIVLLLGRDGQDPLFLQVKEAGQSVLEGYVGASGYANHGAAGGRRASD